jgi:hypothetical protein
MDHKLAGMRARNRLELEQALEFALIRPLVLEFFAEDNLGGSQRVGSAIAREPDFAVATVTDALDQIVIGNEQSVGQPH